MQWRKGVESDDDVPSLMRPTAVSSDPPTSLSTERRSSSVQAGNISFRVGSLSANLRRRARSSSDSSSRAAAVEATSWTPFAGWGLAERCALFLGALGGRDATEADIFEEKGL